MCLPPLWCEGIHAVDFDSVTSMAGAPLEEATLHPHRGHVDLFQCVHDNRWYLRNAISQEVVPLPLGDAAVPSGSPELWFDEQGFGFVASGPDHVEIHDVMDILQHDVFQAPGGTLGVDLGTREHPIVRWVPKMERLYDRMTFELQWSRAEHLMTGEVELAVFLQRPKVCGSRLVWALPHVVRILMPCVTDNGTWLQKKWTAWARHLDESKFSGQLFLAVEYRRPGVVPDPSRSLPWRACSTAALLVILCRLAFASRRSGGLEQEGLRVRIAAFLEQLLQVLAMEEWEMHLCMDPGAELQPWPALPQGRVPVACQVIGGVVEWPESDEWALAAPVEWLHVARLAPSAQVRLFDLVASLASAGMEVSGFLKQVLSELGRHLDMILCMTLDDEQMRQRLELEAGVKTSKLIGSFSSPSVGDLRTESELRRRLLSFQAACGPALPFLSWAPDKSRVGSRALQNAPLVLPSNVGFAAPLAVLGAPGSELGLTKKEQRRAGGNRVGSNPLGEGKTHDSNLESTQFQFGTQRTPNWKRGNFKNMIWVKFRDVSRNMPNMVLENDRFQFGTQSISFWDKANYTLEWHPKATRLQIGIV